jgi:hypothetical protein
LTQNAKTSLPNIGNDDKKCFFTEMGVALFFVLWYNTSVIGRSLPPSTVIPRDAKVRCQTNGIIHPFGASHFVKKIFKKRIFL